LLQKYQSHKKESQQPMKRVAEAKMGHYLEALPLRLHFRTDLHLMRKAWHMIMGLVIICCYNSGMNRGTAITILASVLGFDLFMETARLHNPLLNEKVLRFWGPFMRAHEVHRMSTVPHYMTATIIAIGVFPKSVAVLALLYLACGDPMASLCGILYGHKGPRFASGKTLVGTAAGVFVCTSITFLYLTSLSITSLSTIALVSVIGGLAGGMAELLPLDIDDNFTIPVVSGFIVWLTFLIFGL
jgi:dolichol kinase